MFDLRDISRFMKEHNVLGSSRGYIDRIVESYTTVTPEKVQKYFLSTLKFSRNFQIMINHKLDLVLPVGWGFQNKIVISMKMTILR